MHFAIGLVLGLILGVVAYDLLAGKIRTGLENLEATVEKRIAALESAVSNRLSLAEKVFSPNSAPATVNTVRAEKP
jgi:uncharacterized membrane-anchored protein YhcB (DUF1043 family)